VVEGDEFAMAAAIERRRVELMSAHALLLHSGALQHNGLTLLKYRPQLASLVVTESIGSGSMGIGNELALTNLISTPHRDSYRLGVYRKGDPRIFVRTTISLAAANTAATHLEKLLRDDDAALLLEAVYLLNEAAAFAEEHHYSLALTIAWTICERLLNWRWEKFLDAHDRRSDGTGSIDKPRRRRLTDNRTYSSAVKAEILCFDGAIQLPLYERLSALRKLRNEWIHGADKYAVSTSDATTAIATVNEMLKGLLAFDFPVGVVSFLHG
jgi:hypothetical protein